MSEPRTTVVIADDHRLFVDGLRSVLESTGGFEVVGQALSGHEALTMCHDLQPDLLMLDVSMPGLNGIETMRRMSAECPRVRVVMVSMHADRRFVIEALKAGARGYILKDTEITGLVDSLRRIMAGEICLGPQITDVVVREVINPDTAASSAFSILSSREREVLQLLAEGKSTKEAADQLNLSPKTIESHRKQLMTKLNLHSIAELTKYAIREGLTQLD